MRLVFLKIVSTDKNDCEGSLRLASRGRKLGFEYLYGTTTYLRGFTLHSMYSLNVFVLDDNSRRWWKKFIGADVVFFWLI